MALNYERKIRSFHKCTVKFQSADATTNPASNAFYSDYVPPAGPAPAAPPPAYHDAVDRTTYPPTLPQQPQPQQQRTDLHV